MRNSEYNLLYEKWIILSKPDGTRDEVSLLDFFKHAHEFKELAGELATQDIALMRFILAILHAVFTRWDIDGEESELDDPEDAINRWSAIWRAKRFPYEVIESYLRSQEDSFYLFDDKKPFYQVHFPGSLQSSEGLTIVPSEKEVKYFTGDIAESGNKVNLFIARDRDERLDFSEAARWLIHMNSFDLAPGGAPPKGVKKINGYKMPWPTSLGLVNIEGRNLYETVMLNWVLGDLNGDEIDIEKPDWELNREITAEDLETTEVPFPTTSVELFSMRHRFIELVRNDTGTDIVSVNVWSGRYMDNKNKFLEPMTIWRKYNDDFVPKIHDPSKQVWRDFSAFFLMTDDNADSLPGVIKWLNILRSKGKLEIPYLILRTVGQDTKNNTAIRDIYTDTLTFNAQLLDEIGNSDWTIRIFNEVQNIEKLGDYAGFLSNNLALASGDKNADNKFTPAKEQVYTRLDGPFRKWLASIDPSSDNLDDKCAAWRSEAKKTIMQLGNELVSSAGDQAMIGRTIEIKKVEYTYAAPKDFNTFVYQMNKYHASKRD